MVPNKTPRPSLHYTTVSERMSITKGAMGQGIYTMCVICLGAESECQYNYSHPN